VFAIGVLASFAACEGSSDSDDPENEAGEAGSMSSAGRGGAGAGGSSAAGRGGAAGGAGKSIASLKGGKSGGPSTGGTGGSAGGTGGTGGSSGGTGGDAGSGGEDATGGTGGSTGGTAGDGGTGGVVPVAGMGGSSGKGGAAGKSAGGAGGKAGSAGASGKGGAAGKAGAGGASGTAPLGATCTSDSACAAGLTCLENNALGGDGPAHGACTAACSSHTTCEELSPGSLCYVFEVGNYCVLGCELGPEGSPKCRSRTDAICSLAALSAGSGECETYVDCAAGQLCSEYECADPIMGCLPACRGDFDCGSGQKCDFGRGLCINSTPPGDPLGTACDTAETDTCNGFCLQSGTGTEGYCSAFCGLTTEFTGCGWDGTGAADFVCLFPTILSTGSVADGDVGVCGELCDCNADCDRPGDYCISIAGTSVEGLWGHPGYCSALQPEETLADTVPSCPSG
jgi:hypothetical protein